MQSKMFKIIISYLQDRKAPLLTGRALCPSSFCELKSECCGNHRQQRIAEGFLHHALAPPPGSLGF